MKKLIFMLTVLSCMSAVSCSNEQEKESIPENMPNDIILEWNEIAYEAFGGKAYLHSLMASRINAMTQLAMHDALNAIYGKYATYTFTGIDPLADPVAAVATAAYTVLVNEIPEKKSFLDSALQQNLISIEPGDALERGIRLGKEAGQAIISNRMNDGSSGDPISPVPVSDIAGVYQAVPPFDFVFAPYWTNVKPFGIRQKDQFRAAPHPTTESEEYAEAFNEVKASGGISSSKRTEDQSAYAHFWYEFSEAGWNRVARTVAKSKKLDMLETARMLALVDMAIADAYIAGWDSKFYYDFWRPYTAIHKAGTDGNAMTTEDLHWEPQLPTPPVQDYPSTHSALANAAATVMEKILGNETAFTMISPSALPGSNSRSFDNVRQAADENADSRVMAGIHFRFACKAGQEMGDKIGEYIAGNYLKKLK